MESQLYSKQLQKSREEVEVDAIKFAILGTIFYIPSYSFSLLTLHLEPILWGVFLYLPVLLSSFLGFICSRTHNKSYLGCYSFTLVISAIYFGVIAVITIVSIIKLLSFECEDDLDYESCSDSKNIDGGIAASLLFLEIFLVISCVLMIYAIGNLHKVKGLLSREMKEYQVHLMT